MTVAIITLSAANSQCCGKLKFFKHFPVVSVVQFFMVVLHHQPSDSLLTADNKVQGKTASFEVLVPISTEIWRPFREAWGGLSSRLQMPEPEEGSENRFPKSRGWDAGHFKVQADNQNRAR